MSPEFCEHLVEYRELYLAVEDAYGDCLRLMDEIIASGPAASQVEKLQDALEEWQTGARNLRQAFVTLTEQGHVLLPLPGQDRSPVCGHCGQEVSRLEFPEFVFQEDGTMLFRGRELSAAAPVPA